MYKEQIKIKWLGTIGIDVEIYGFNRKSSRKKLWFSM